MPCSPTSPPHVCRDPAYLGESPSASRKLQPDLMRGVNGSEGAETRGVWDRDSASEMDETPSFHSTGVPTSTTTTRESPTMTDQEVTYEIYNYILELMEPNGVDTSLSFERASLNPPITAESLAELDMQRIINNPKLRHDVNFDRELHFRPNMDGSRGRHKMRSTDEYWQALEGELFMYAYGRQQLTSTPDLEAQDYWMRVLKTSQRRIRHIFEAVRDILKTLVPDHEQQFISDRLDVDLIMQEIQNGVCDLIDMSTWLATVIKAHCAPMRDELVDRMQRDIERGAREGKNELLVSGLRQLLAILESMRLDVANHQIRHMRPLLVEDTVNFQQRYNAHRLLLGKVNITKSQAWLAEEMDPMADNPVPVPNIDALGAALLRDLLYNEEAICPPIFHLDVDRLRALRTELHGHVYINICCDILADVSPRWQMQTEIQKAQAVLMTNVRAIAGTHGRFADRLENIAVEIVRLVLILEGRYLPVDQELYLMIEDRLAHELHPASPTFDKYAKSTCERLLPKLRASVDIHSRMSAMALQDALVPAIANHTPVHTTGYGAVYVPAVPSMPSDPDEDVVRRLTHVVCLHWQVWADLVYLAPPKNYFDSNTTLQVPTPFPSASASPTIPVFGPGTMWPSLGVTVTEVASGMPTPSPSPGSSPAPTHENSEHDGVTSDPSAPDHKHTQRPS